MTPVEQAGPVVQWGMGTLVAIVALGWVLALRRAGGMRWGALGGVVLLGWAGLTGALAASGMLLNTALRPPPFVVLLVVVLGTGLGVGFSAVGQRLVAAFPLWALVAVQGFRFPLELVMHQAAAERVMPVALTWTGYNLDIVTGVLACVLAPLVAAGKAPRALVTAWNVWGFVALAIIAVVAMATSPMVRALGEDQVNTLVTFVPYIWLPTLLVPTALAGHILVARKLKSSPLH